MILCVEEKKGRGPSLYYVGTVECPRAFSTDSLGAALKLVSSFLESGILEKVRARKASDLAVKATAVPVAHADLKLAS